MGDYVDGWGNDDPLALQWNGTTWSAVNPPSPLGAFTSVSCIAADRCVAAGTAASSPQLLAEAFDGTTWTPQNVPTPGGAQSATLSGVSCASVSACVAVGSFTDSTGALLTLSETWNGTAWSQANTIDSSTSTDLRLSAVSCATSTACTAVGQDTDSAGVSQPLIEAWNGSAWSTQKPQIPTNSEGAQLKAVACPSNASCRAFGDVTTPTSDGGYTGAILAESASGSTWALTAFPVNAPSDNEVAGVACPSATKCISVGAGYTAAMRSRVWNGTTWAMHTVAGSGSLLGISCPTTVMCLAVGYGNGSGVDGPLGGSWNGSAWTARPALTPTGSASAVLYAVSCVSTTWCMAVGEYTDSTNVEHPLAETWNGSTWKLQPSAHANVNENWILTGVSCTSITSCVSVSAAFAEAWNGTKWTYSSISSPSGSSPSLDAVSCATASWCVAVGDYTPATSSYADTLIDVWNGTSWTAANPGNTPTAGELFGVSCTATTFCQAVGGQVAAGVTFADGWNGTVWTPTMPPNPAGINVGGTQLNSVACSGTNACTAVGTANVGGTDVSLAERYS